MSKESFDDLRTAITRRYFFNRAATGLGTAALASCLNPSLFANTPAEPQTFGTLPGLHREPKAKRIIWLFMDVAQRLFILSFPDT